MLPRQAGLAALLLSVPGWVAISALWALSQISAPAAGLAGLAVLLVTMAMVRYLAKDVVRLRAWLRERGENPSDGAAPVTGTRGDITGDVRRLERHWQQQHAAQSREIGGYLAMLDGLPDPVLSVDEQAHVVFANTAARALLSGDNGVGSRATPPAGPCRACCGNQGC